MDVSSFLKQITDFSPQKNHLFIEYLDTLTLGNNPTHSSLGDNQILIALFRYLVFLGGSLFLMWWTNEHLLFPLYQPVRAHTALHKRNQCLKHALSLFCLSSKSDEDNLQPIPPSRGTAFHTTAPTPSLFPPTSQSSTNTLTTTTNPKLQDAWVNTMVGGGVRRQRDSSVRLGVRMTFLR